MAIQTSRQYLCDSVDKMCSDIKHARRLAIQAQPLIDASENDQLIELFGALRAAVVGAYLGIDDLREATDVPE